MELSRWSGAGRRAGGTNTVWRDESLGRRQRPGKRHRVCGFGKPTSDTSECGAECVGHAVQSVSAPGLITRYTTWRALSCRG